MAAKNSALHQRNKLHFKIFKIDFIFLWQNLFHNITDFCCRFFNQTNAALLSIKVVLFQKQYKVLLISKLLNCLLLFYLYYLH